MNKPWKDHTIYMVLPKTHSFCVNYKSCFNNHPIIKEKTHKLVKASAEKMILSLTAFKA